MHTEPGPYPWRLTVPRYGVCTTVAYSAGEARAKVKEHLGIARKDRLPEGTLVERMPKEVAAA